MNGLSNEEIIERRNQYGYNRIDSSKKENCFIKILNIIKEPMFLLLIAASLIYFILGEISDGIIMLVFVVGIISIDIFQELKTDRTLEALKKLSCPKVTVIRNGEKKQINSELLVPDDIMIIKEGDIVSADGIIIKNNGLCINEGILTGESALIWKSSQEDKDNYFKNNYVYSGSLALHGTAYVKVTAIGSETEYGKIGKNLNEITKEKSNLKKQIDKLVFVCAIFAFILFLVVILITFLNLNNLPLKSRIIESILSGITIAMCMIPEEFPVVLTVFLSMGAYRLAKKNAIIRNLNSVETLGAISVLCVDKTGTITTNQMFVNEIYSKNYTDKEVIEIMGLCCEEETFDSMEKSILKKCDDLNIEKSEIFQSKIKYYPFNDEDKMMGIIRNYNDKCILAAKGSIESLLKITDVPNKKEILSQSKKLSKKGLRVLGVCKKEILSGDYKDNLNEETLEFVGLVGFMDMPRKNIEKEISTCYSAGIRIIMITGDNGDTALAIAKKVGIKNSDKYLTGEELHNLTFAELKEQVKNINIYCRVIPEDKYNIIRALKENGSIVAMTGDGVNDAPALKYSDIGIAMSKRGSEVSRDASDLILLDDNFKTITETIKDGRRIYDNLKRAVGYIFTIHIPIALIALVSPLFGISPNNLMLLPVHIVLLELIIDPTCSIVLEREPEEKNIMNRKPRNKDENLISVPLVLQSFIQGFIMFLSSFILYFIILKTTSDAVLARTMGIITIMIENYFLVIANSSMLELSYKSFIKLIKDKVLKVISFIFIFMIIIILYTPFSSVVKLTSLSLGQFIIVLIVSFVSIFWFDLVKISKRKFSLNLT